MLGLRWFAAGVVVVGLTLPATSSLAARRAHSRALETITVSNTNGKTVKATTKLVAGHTYRITAKGTISDWCAPTAKQASDCSNGSPLAIAQGVDAIYCYATWRCPSGRELWRHLTVNGLGLDQFAGLKMPYSASHTYTLTFEAEDAGPLVFRSIDTSTTDNSGSFSVTIVDLGPDFQKNGSSPATSSVVVNLDYKQGFSRSEATLRNGGTFKICNQRKGLEVLFSRTDDEEMLFRDGVYSLRINPGQCISRTLRNPTKKPILLRIFAEALSGMKEQGIDLTVLP